MFQDMCFLAVLRFPGPWGHMGHFWRDLWLEEVHMGHFGGTWGILEKRSEAGRGREEFWCQMWQFD